MYFKLLCKNNYKRNSGYGISCGIQIYLTLAAEYYSMEDNTESIYSEVV